MFACDAKNSGRFPVTLGGTVGHTEDGRVEGKMLWSPTTTGFFPRYAQHHFTAASDLCYPTLPDYREAIYHVTMHT